MIRTQIQLPEILYKEVQRVAATQEWSIAEVIRRGAESVVRAYPALKQKPEAGFKFPTPIGTRMLVHEARELKDLIREDAEKP
jgi:hypothetical protein